MVERALEVHRRAEPCGAQGDGCTQAAGPCSDGSPRPASDEATSTGRPQEDIDRLLQIEVAQLRRAMQTRPVIDQARGVLMATFGLTSETAWDVLVMTSQNTNTKLHSLAFDLVATIQGTPLATTVQEQLAAAVAKVMAAQG